DSGVSAADLQCFTSWVTDLAAQPPPPPPPAPGQFEPFSVASSLSKLKLLLHGGAVTSAELAAVRNGGNGEDGDRLNRTALREVIASWRDSEGFVFKMKAFLRLSLQQYNFDIYPYQSQFGPLRGGNPVRRDLLTNNLEEMFIRTAWNIVSSDGDFRQVVTTRTWQVTTAILAALVYADEPAFDGEQFRYFTHLNEADYSDWRDVTFVQETGNSPGPSFTHTAAFANALRAIPNGGTLALSAPRVGFFTSPTFFANWQTNEDNQHRVTTNQTMIVALDRLFETGDTTQQPNLNGLADEHAMPGTACYQCHRLMDPMRLQFQNVYTVGYRARTTPQTTAPSFAFHGYIDAPATMDEFAATIVAHPRFPVAWVQKLCMWANTQRCAEDDPEFIRLVDSFAAHFNFLDLVVEAMSSPLFTGASRTPSASTHPLFVSIARRDHLCLALRTRVREAREEKCAAAREVDPQATPAVCTPRVDIDCDSGIIKNASQLISGDTFGRGNRDFVQS
ncbi:MAG: hypothetical protein AAFN74_27535, partial [Myxococcota bacterium]